MTRECLIFEFNIILVINVRLKYIIYIYIQESIKVMNYDLFGIQIISLPLIRINNKYQSKNNS